jgi:transcriptional regulator with XRE-family HTH domain
MNIADIGSVIRDARKKAGLNQAEVATRLGISRPTLSLLENGMISDLGVRKILAIADRLGLELTIQPRTRAPILPEVFEQLDQERKKAEQDTDSYLQQRG